MSKMPERDICILSLDDGGNQALSQLFILQRLMETVDPEDPPKPCDCFDLIGGSGTGGLFAVLLGRLAMSVDECIETYVWLLSLIREASSDRVQSNGEWGRVFLDPRPVVDGLKQIVMKEGFSEDELLRTTPHAKCKVVLPIPKDAERKCLKSYHSVADQTHLNDVKIWEACYETLAASSFMVTSNRWPSVLRIDEDINPIWEIWSQARLLWDSRLLPLERRVKCLVSLGARVPWKKQYMEFISNAEDKYIEGLGERLGYRADESGKKFILENAHLAKGERYHRLRVSERLVSFEFKVLKEREEIEQQTYGFLRSSHMQDELQRCARKFAPADYSDVRSIITLKHVWTITEHVPKPAEIALFEEVRLRSRHSQRHALVIYDPRIINRSLLTTEIGWKNQQVLEQISWFNEKKKDELQKSIFQLTTTIPPHIFVSFWKIIVTARRYLLVHWIRSKRLFQQNEKLFWFLIFLDSKHLVDEVTFAAGFDGLVFDVTHHFPGTKSGVILLTTELPHEKYLVDFQILSSVTDQQISKLISTRASEIYYSENKARSYKKIPELHTKSSPSTILFPKEKFFTGMGLRFSRRTTTVMSSEDTDDKAVFDVRISEPERAINPSKETATYRVFPFGPSELGKEFAEALLSNEEVRKWIAQVAQGYKAHDRIYFERMFMHFLRRYCVELRNEAATDFERDVARSIYTSILYVTKTLRTEISKLAGQKVSIVSREAENKSIAQSQSRESLDRVGNQSEIADNDSNDDNESLSNVPFPTSFLISAKAFITFQNNLKSIAGPESSRQQLLDGEVDQSKALLKITPFAKVDEQVIKHLDRELIYAGLWKWMRRYISRLLRSPVAPGLRRFEWICDCGDLLYMDFSSTSTRNASTIEALCCYQSATALVSANSETSEQPLEASEARTQGISEENTDQRNKIQNTVDALNSIPDPRTSLALDSSTSTSEISSGNIYLELCVNVGKYLKKLGEIDVSPVRTDGEFFRTIREHYHRLRGFRTQFWLLQPANVSYVRFSVEDRHRVGILHKPVALPPKLEVDAKRYHYDPCPLENELPISSDLFLHYTFSCSSPSKNLVWVPRIPRKLETSVLASPDAACYGWGVHIDEGPDYLKILLLNLIGLILSGVAALLWDHFKHDFQGAMGLAAWTVMLLNTIMFIFVVKWKQE